MRLKWIHNASLRVRLLALLGPVMGLLVITSLWLTRTDAVASANAAYDRSLLGAIKALDLNVSTASGGLSVELPYRLFEFFELTATGNVYFRVATIDGFVEIGNPDLPSLPDALKPRLPQFYDALYFDETVRVGAFMRELEQPLGANSSTWIVIQVAESTASRQAFTGRFVRRTVLRDALLLIAMSVAVIVGLMIALQPITALAKQTRARAPEDLSPLQTEGIPSDVRPLVDAINQQLERTEHLAQQRRQMVDDASHQLRTPLATLRAQLDFVLRENDLTQQQAALKALSEELNHAIRATNQLLNLAHQDASKPIAQAFDLGQLVRDVALELLPLARQRQVDLGVEINQLHHHESTLSAQGDANMLHQALINLVHNAIEHGRASGVVTLKASAQPKHFCIEVIDDGDGIEPEVLSRLGERFAKGRSSRGSGLGLAIARTVMTHHGGHLRVVLTPASLGTNVSMQWPRA